MIKIQKIFFCDHVEVSQFNKRDFIGVILAKEILINSLPYKFLSNLVILGETASDCQIILEVSSKQQVLYSIPMDIEIGKPGIVNGVIQVAKLEFNMSKIGNLYLKIFHENQLIFSDEYSFIIGESPFLNQYKHLPNSGIFSKEKDIKLIKEVISLAKKSVIIIDNYIRNGLELRKLLDSIVDIDNEIYVFTLSRYKKNMELDRLIFSDFQNLKIFYTTPTQELQFHDRFIIIDRTAYYTFGASLNDISKNKISGFKKITSIEEIKRIDEIIIELSI